MKHKRMFSIFKTMLSLTFLLVFLLPAHAQIFDPVKFVTEVKSNDDGTIDLITRAKIDQGWKLYAQETAEDMGPVPTTFSYNLPEGVELIGTTKEPEAPFIYDDVFEMNIKSFKKEAVFTQKVKISTAISSLSGEVEFMTCDDERCLPPEIKALQWNIDNSVVDTKTTAAPNNTTSALFDIEQDNTLLKPVSWTANVARIDDTTYEVVYKATIEEKWHLYSQNLPEGGAQPTEFIYENPAVKAQGKAKESKSVTAYDPVFEMDQTYFDGSATFTHRLVVDAEVESSVAEINYQACDDEVCIFDNQRFIINFKALSVVEEGFDEVSFTDPTTTVEADNSTEVAEASSDSKETKGLWTIFIIAFFSGFAALLTPCVFPMIPMTVSFFTKQSKSRAEGISNAVLYGVSIVVIYVFLGYLVTKIFGADALNALSTNVVFNIVFFLLLIVFAISFLGAFEIVLPNSWANKADKMSMKGGLIGIFFMALALAIVSFSCTGPIVGTLLVEASRQGGHIAPIIGMLGFSLAIALPFMFFAMFPGYLNSLPRSGGWLNSVKVTLGFLELALAFKFLSNADLVLQAHWLEREVFLAIWIAVFLGMAFYLFGFIKLPHDGDDRRIGVGRLFMALLTLTFVIYLIPGLWGAPLKLISGFPPPMQYSESPYGVGGSAAASVDNQGIPPGAKKGPQDIWAFTDYQKGLDYAKSVNKPALIDFTGHACVNCRKMEERVWSEPKILQLLKNEVVLISLYVDEKKDLPQEEQYVSPTTGKKIKTVGNKWSDFQIKNYNINAQPYYVLIDNNERVLNEPSAYEPNIERYYEWLKNGIEAYKK